MYYFVEPMTEADIPQVQAIEQASFHTNWSAMTYRRELRNTASCRYVVARASPTPPPPREERPRRNGLFSHLFGSLVNPHYFGGAAPLIGYGGLWVTLEEGHITVIAVDPPYRGRGIGELLLNSLIDAAFDMGANALTLEVRDSNTVAQQLYLKYGFLPAGKRKRYYTDNGEDALIMWTEPMNTPEYQARLRSLRQQLYTRLRDQVPQP